MSLSVKFQLEIYHVPGFISETLRNEKEISVVCVTEKVRAWHEFLMKFVKFGGQL